MTNVSEGEKELRERLITWLENDSEAGLLDVIDYDIQRVVERLIPRLLSEFKALEARKEMVIDKLPDELMDGLVGACEAELITFKEKMRERLNVVKVYDPDDSDRLFLDPIAVDGYNRYPQDLLDDPLLK